MSVKPLHPSTPTPLPRPTDSLVQLGSGLTHAAEVALFADRLPNEMPAVPGFELQGEIAKGGMGIVYQARDLAMNRIVAIKVLQAKYAPGSTAASRFVDEAQITGQLQHPGIPPIYQVGRLADGRPYLAMKLIKGETLAAKHQRGERINTLAVIEAIAQAVGYAHAHGVLHRDLKPANVMVGPFGEVQVMDWGLAKFMATGPASTRCAAPDAVSPVTTFFDPRSADSGTQVGTVLGTPAFMAPEQAAGETDKLDPRTDVFGLGAILCFLLTGQPPFTGTDAHAILVQASRGKTDDAFARLDASGAEPEVVALCKHCLAFEPKDRPANGDAVAQAVAALRAAAEERARRAEIDRAKAEVFAQEQRKRRGVWIALASALLVGVVASSLLAVWANSAREDEAKAREVAQRERDEKEKQRAKAEAAQKEAERNEAIATGVLNFVQETVFAVARPSGKPGGKGKDVKVIDAMRDTLPLMGQRFKDQPLVEARLRMTIGNSFWYLGEYKVASEQFTRARDLYTQHRGLQHNDTLSSMMGLAMAYADEGRTAEALELYQDTLRLRRALLGADHADTLRLMKNYSQCLKEAGRLDEAQALIEETLRLRRAKYGPDEIETLRTMERLAEVHVAAGRIDQAFAVWEEILQLQAAKAGPNDQETLGILHNLAVRAAQLGRAPQAVRYSEEKLRRLKSSRGVDHPDTLKGLRDLVYYTNLAGQAERVVVLREEILRQVRAKQGPDHAETLSAMALLAQAHAVADQGPAALRLYEELLLLQSRKLGAEHPTTLLMQNNVAWHLSTVADAALRDPARAVTLAEKVVQLAPNTAAYHDTLGTARYRAGDWKGAVLELEKAISLRPPDKRDTADGRFFLAMGYWQLSEKEKASAAFDQAVRHLSVQKKPSAELKRFHAEAATLLGRKLEP